MKINLLTGDMELANSLRRYLRHVMGVEPGGIRALIFGKEPILSREILNTDFWIAEAWNLSEPENPEGFRTLRAMAGKAKCLVIFLFTPEGFPQEGPFWCRLPCLGLKEKIRRAMESPPPTQQDYQTLIDLWPDLAYDPGKHGHHSKKA